MPISDAEYMSRLAFFTDAVVASLLDCPSTAAPSLRPLLDVLLEEHCPARLEIASRALVAACGDPPTRTAADLWNAADRLAMKGSAAGDAASVLRWALRIRHV